MATANIKELASAISYRKQADLATLPGAANFWNLSRINTATATVSPNTEDDAQDVGKADEMANNVFPMGIDASVVFEKYASSEVFSFLAAFSGAFAKTAPDTGALRYTATPLVTGIELPSFSYVEAIRQGGSALFDRGLVGCVLQDWGYELNSGQGRQNFKVKFTAAGSGKIVQPSTITIPSAFVEHGLNAGSVAISILGTNYVSTKRLVSLSWNTNNNTRLDQGFFPGSGVDSDGFQIRGRMENGDRTWECNFKVRLENGSTELADLKAQTEGTATITAQGALITGTTYHDFSHTLHRVRISAAVIDEDSGICTVSVTLRPLKHASNGLYTMYATCAQDNIGAAAV